MAVRNVSRAIAASQKDNADTATILNCSWYLYRNTSTHKPAANHSPWNGLSHVHMVGYSSLVSNLAWLVAQLSADFDNLLNSLYSRTVFEFIGGVDLLQFFAL